jgi:hypothetical protein
VYDVNTFGWSGIKKFLLTLSQCKNVWSYFHFCLPLVSDRTVAKRGDHKRKKKLGITKTEF